jgi:CHAT domain-containing protein
MKYPTLLLIFFIAAKVFSQTASIAPQDPSPGSIARQFKMHDDAVNFIYTCLDSFLANPTEKRLTILESFDRTMWRPLKNDDEYIAYVILLCNKGYYSTRFGDINKALDAYETAWKIYNDHDLAGFDIIEYCLKPLGNNYSMLGDYQSAANVIRNYLFIAEKQNNFLHLIAAFINLSVVYHDTGRQEEAIALLNSALKVKGLPEFKKGIIYSNLARNFLDLQQPKEAQRYATLALKHLQKDNDEEASLQLVNTLKILSLIGLTNENPGMALSYIEKARSIVNAHPAFFKKREMAKLITEHANIHARQNHTEAALQNYQEALVLLLPGYEPDSAVDLPDSSFLYPENAIKETLDGLAGVYSKNDPAKALRCFELSFVVEDLLRQTYHYQEDRLQQQMEIRQRTELSLALLFDLFNKTKDQQFVQQAFQLAERTKAIVLKEAIAANTRSRLIKQDSLLKKEHDLIFKKATFATNLVLEQMKGEAANVGYINDLIARQTELSLEIKSLQKLIVQKYPHYKTGMATRPIDIRRLRQKLDDENAIMIEYVAGRETLYAFIIDAHILSFHQITNGAEVYDHIRTLNDLFSSAAGINNEIELYKRMAFELSAHLRIPASTDLKKLVIVPDGLLNYLPFEALLLQENSSLNYAALPYLIKKFTVAYESSATNFVDYRRSSSSANDEVLAMFPVFKNSQRSLTHSETEARNIQSFVKGKFLFDRDATKKAFGENIHNYSIIHLSTHAAAGSWLEPPSIDFIDSTLYLPEVYGLQLQPDLMVLSACETGVGKILKGEGALSLARGFQYAGANNIVFSLWKVNDRSTAGLMTSFYQNFFNHHSVPEALRRSKLDYLENDDISNAHKSPYFWAPFIYYGDISDNTLIDKPIWPKILVAVLSLLVLLILLVRLRKRFLVLKK